MTHKQLNAAILRLRKIEKQSSLLQSKIDAKREQWEDLKEMLNGTDEWANSCHESNLSEDYNFGDILA